jgi:hypothetical protein
MKFMLNRNRTISSLCGISIEFKKGELHLVPPAMYAEVIAAGGVPESELSDDELPAQPATPEALAEREKAIFAAFEKIMLRADRMEFTAGGMPHNAVLSREVGWTVQAKERDAAWVKFTAGKDD